MPRDDFRYTSGIFFISIAVGIVSASYMSEIAYIYYYYASPYIYPLVWIGVFVLSIYLFRLKNPDIFKVMSTRFRQSISWPRWAKAVNGLAWTLPFLLIALYPVDYQYLILLGIGCGNISTYILGRITGLWNGCRMRRDGDKKNGGEGKSKEHGRERIGADSDLGKEQLIVGVVSSSLLPVAILVGSSSLLPADLLHMLPRLFIAVAYASGGIYALIGSDC
ncbi:hypothetical protein HRbin04_00708 [archaeon HR04]|nr:hypothetical protein HRbin04_00708 [archaeon HR04]